MIKVILWDMDATLLDFLAAERAAMKTCFKIFHLGECTDEMIGRYSKINRRYWEMLERGEMSKKEILIRRFQEFFQSEGIETDCETAFNARYQLELGETICYQDDSYELLKKLQTKVRQFIVTNGTFVAQEKKLKRSGFGELVEDVFISELLGHEKPSVQFFEKVFEEIGDYRRDEMMIVGDSLTSDMRGGNNAGILCCWYNPLHLENTTEVKVDHEIDHLWKIEEILKNYE